ncbi:MAG: hypothetical protein UT33_C0005G0151 [Candidatus Peregrinibacteria bacterium GW2011_GWC2_39_14]|nr:MAG: hypothetical protein US92_C0001G0152 [Candidatus Peregrinibacteria bacterium GW2011_GWA2_38_36]KKR07207.1 MAG: hypothetical protein UT33_C0005G0151 [Candidatus Peregrinibacteria bacterium GW2011_GWC2_39_14]
MKKISLILAILLLSLTFAGCSKQQASKVSAEVEIADQSISAGKVIIDKASIPEKGWVAVHELGKEVFSGYEPGKVLGWAAIEGANTNVEVAIGPTASKRIMVVVHSDKGQIGVFEFPGADAEVYIENDKRIMTIFNVAK